MSELEDALANVRQEGENPFAEVEKDTPVDSPSTEEPKEEQPVEGEDTLPTEHIPFHEHPRWKAREEELRELRERDGEREREIAELRSFRDDLTKHNENSTVPDWFRELYGDNQFAWQKFSEHEQARTEEIKRSLQEEQRQVQARQVEETTRWNRWVDDEITKLQADGRSFDRNKLIKVMLDYRPTDDSNNFDFEKGYRIYEALEAKDAPNTHARKQVADLAAPSPKGEAKPKDYLTSNDLRNKSWSNL